MHNTGKLVPRVFSAFTIEASPKSRHVESRKDLEDEAETQVVKFGSK